jgi:hypothetical protein
LKGEGGTRGARGADGAAGLSGATGARGADGTHGAPGAPGAPGVNGTNGAPGTNGTNGAPGTPGTNGINGTDGLNGVNGTTPTPEYAHFYNMGSQAIADGSAVEFDTNGLKTASVIHAAGTSGIVLGAPGTYKVTMSILATVPFRFALFRNLVVIPGSEFAANGSTRQAISVTIIAVAANDVVTLRNYGSGQTINLDVNAAITGPVVDASIVLERLA